MEHHNNDTFDNDVSRHKAFQEFDQAIREANRVAVHALAGSLTKERVLRVAAAVSKLRARYLSEVVKMGDTAAETNLDPTGVLDLRQLREAYEEALHGFGALRHAMERRYIDIEDV